MTALTAIAPLNATKADFAERAGTVHLQRIRSQLAASGHPPGTLVAIAAVSGDYVLGHSDLDVVDRFQKRFGTDAIGWVAELAD